MTQAARDTIDWDAIKRSMTETEAALQRAQTADRNRIEETYRRRAHRLARRCERTSGSRAATPVLVFRMAEERYAVPCTELTEICPLSTVTRVPDALPELRGVVNLSGEICSVMDLAAVLGLPAKGEGPREPGMLLVLRRSEREIGLRVDAVESTRDLSGQDLLLPDGQGAGDAGGFVSAVTSDGVALLDAERLLAHPAFGRPQQSKETTHAFHDWQEAGRGFRGGHHADDHQHLHHVPEGRGDAVQHR